MDKGLENNKDEILELFKNTKREVLTGRYILDNTKIDRHNLHNLHLEGILEANPDWYAISPDPKFNNYALTKYYKRLVVLEEIENGV